MTEASAPYRPDLSLKGKLRRRLVRLQHRRPAPRGPERGWVTFSFDDAPETAVETGAAVLEARGIAATYFICAGLAGTRAHLGRYADASQVRAAAARGHEIACHTFSHLDCGGASAAEVEADLARNARAFADWGVAPAQTFAYPYGDVSGPAKRVLGARFALSRALQPGRIGVGADLAQAPATSMDGPRGEASTLAALHETAGRGGWLILFAHQVTPEPGEFAVHPDALARMADAARGLRLEPVTAAEGARRLFA